MKKPSVDVAQEAIELVRHEVNQWENCTAWITDKVAFRMRDLIRTLRKNYWGVFDEPTDPVTGRKKIWIPLTQSLCDAVTKNIDLDQKDVNVRAKKQGGESFASLTRAAIRNFLDSIFFGEHLDVAERQLAVDGTVVWKTIEIDGKPEKKDVDLLNFYIDPTEECIYKAFRVTERALLTPDQVKSMDGWVNTDVVGTVGLPRADRDLTRMDSDSASFVDVYELWGQIPKKLITGKKSDKEMVEGHIVVSGLEGKGPKCHLIEENISGLKPYEEAWYTKVQGRWYGVGIAEKVMMLQVWLNTIVNIRINRSYVSQLGLFKIKRGAGITPQMLSRLGANGGILVNNLDDIEQFVMQEVSQSSFADERNITDWAQRVTSAFEVVTGESLPASTTATSVATQQTGAMSQFSMVKEGFGMFLQRWMDRHVIPILAKNMEIDDIVRISGADILKDISENIAAAIAIPELDAAMERGELPTEQELQQFIAEAQELVVQKPELFIQTTRKIMADLLEAKVYVTTEELNPGVLATNLINMLNIVQATRPDLVEPISRQVFDLFGLDFPRVRKTGMPGADYQQMMSPETAQTQMTGATTMGNMQKPMSYEG